MSEQTNIVQHEYVLPYDATAYVEEFIAHLQRKFSGLTLGISHETTPVRYKRQDRWIDGFRLTVTLTVPVIRHEGYAYRATVKRVLLEDETTDIQVFTVDDNDPTDWTGTPFDCHHCGHNRRRNTVHVFVNDSGELRIIGSTCSKGYFGIDIARQIDNLFRVRDILIGEEREFFGGRWGMSAFSNEEFAKVCYGIIRKTRVYTSKKQAETSGKASTADHAAYLLNAPGAHESPQERAERAAELKEAYTAAGRFDWQAIRGYWEAKDQSDTFNHNTTVALKMLEPRYGFIAFAVFTYLRDVEDFTGEQAAKRAAMEARQASVHVGAIKERLRDIPAVVTRMRGFENDFGYTTLMEFLGEDGNVYSWWASGCLEDDYDIGQRLLLTGTIKKHDTYRGVAQTVLTRCKLVITN